MPPRRKERGGAERVRGKGGKGGGERD